jgi:hypothetical protein
LTKLKKYKYLQNLSGTVEQGKRYFKAGGRADGVTKSDLADFLKTTEAIANDPNGSAKLEAAVFEDQERKVRAAFSFTTEQAQQASHEIAEHRKEPETRTDENQARVLLRFVRPSVEAGKPGKKGGERGVIDSINKRVADFVCICPCRATYVPRKISARWERISCAV